MYQLLVPEVFARCCIERQQTIAEQILALPVTTVKIKRRRAQRNVYRTFLLIKTHACPATHATGLFIGFFIPGIITELARLRNGMKGPGNFTGAYIVCTNKTRGCVIPFS